MAHLEAPQGEEFDAHTRRISNVRELYDVLAEMSDEHFSRFVNAHKNDFARWIEHSLNSKFLAARVRRCMTREQLRKQLFMEIFL